MDTQNAQPPSNDGLRGGLVLLVLGAISIVVGMVIAQWLLSAWL